MQRIHEWKPDDPEFWQISGKKTATRNLWISVPCLLCAFAVWMYWSIIIVQMQNLGFPFSTQQLYTLTAVAGLTGASLRIPNSFMIAVCGGRYVVAITTALLLIPATGTGIALQNIETPYFIFVVLAALSGIGGGNFASSMSNISAFFPKKAQGTALGINAGLGNIGVSIMQALIPLVMLAGIFGTFGGSPIELPSTVGNTPAGTSIWIQNAGLVWVPVLFILSIIAWHYMNNLPQHACANAAVALRNILWLNVLGFVASAAGLYLLLGMMISMWIVLPLTIICCLLLIRYATPRSIQDNIKRQFAIFNNKHTWFMTWLYIMTFGSFIGYSATFPKLIQDVFGTLPDGSLNPAAPNPFAYAWLGPLVGSLIRPVGGWRSDKFGGAKVTQWDTVAMILSALGVAYFIRAAHKADTPETFFLPFLVLFMLLFITAGIGNGSTFRMIPVIFPGIQAGPVLGWTSAVAAYGAFIIPKLFGAQIEAGNPEYALYGFSLFYFSCLILNWWFYARKNASTPC